MSEQANAAPEGQSVAQKVKETVTNRLKEIRDQIGPLITEEAELAEMAPDEKPEFGQHREPAAAPAAPPVPRAAPAEPVRRTRKGGTRAEQAVAFVAEHPGSSASEIAKAMKIQPNYLYRVLADLEAEGQVEKDGRQYKVPA